MTTSNPSGVAGRTRTRSFPSSYCARGHFSKTLRISPTMRGSSAAARGIPQFTASQQERFLNEKIARLLNRNKSATCSTNVVLIIQHDTFWGPRVESSQLEEASFRSYRFKGSWVVTVRSNWLLESRAT